jgi:hypothetical protein
VKDNVGEFTFYKDEKGVVTHYILRVSGNARTLAPTSPESLLTNFLSQLLLVNVGSLMIKDIA